MPREEFSAVQEQEDEDISQKIMRYALNEFDFEEEEEDN